MGRNLLIILKFIILNFSKVITTSDGIGPGDGFENQKLFIIRYTKDYQVIMEE